MGNTRDGSAGRGDQREANRYAEQGEIVLGRVGHYYDAGNGSCATALVVDVAVQGELDIPVVNIQAWHHGGTPFSRASVPVVAHPSTDDSNNTFHLSRDCPWGR